MAKLNPGSLGLNGSAGNLSFYTRWDIDGVIVRTKGGPSKETIKRKKTCKRLRQANAEFSGRSTASKWIMGACDPLKPLVDYNIAGPVNGLLVSLQGADTTSEPGQRNLQLSQNPRLLEGFSFNRKTSFDTVIRTPIGCSLSRETLSARVDIPELLPGINFHYPAKQTPCPLFSIQVVLGLVPDFFYVPGKKKDKRYAPNGDGFRLHAFHNLDTNWFPVLKGAAATTLSLQLNKTPPNSSFTLLLGIGIRFGTLYDTNSIKQVERTGVAKILAAV